MGCAVRAERVRREDGEADASSFRGFNAGFSSLMIPLLFPTGLFGFLILPLKYKIQTDGDDMS